MFEEMSCGIHTHAHAQDSCIANVRNKLVQLEVRGSSPGRGMYGYRYHSSDKVRH